MSQPQAALRAHEFDGVREFDNRLPNWWLWTFYIACLFSVGYWFHYHVLGTGPLPAAEYQRELEAAAATVLAADVTDESLAKLAQEPAAVAAGRKIWMTHCFACHKEDGGGSVGPNLTDRFWIHGNSPTAIHATIVNGVPEKGMLAWKNVIGPTACRQVAAYVLTLRDANVAGGKEPQGEELR
jgi:cytochrome c oxidase cbb3-type subunit 3